MNKRWLLLGGGAVLLVLGVLWFRRTGVSNQPRGQGVQAGTATGLQPGMSAPALTADQLGLATGDLQFELSGIVQQISADFASLQQNQQVQPSQNTVTGGGCAGVDAQQGLTGGLFCGGGPITTWHLPPPGLMLGNHGALV